MTANLHPDIVDDLALAVVGASTAPVILLDGDLRVLAASSSFYQAFQIAPSGSPGKVIMAMGAGEWDVPQLRSLLTATVAGHAQIDAYEIDLKREGAPDRQLIVNAKKLDYGNPQNVRLLVALVDVTETRLADKSRAEVIRQKDDLLREKAVLLQELQHRVANSLQIIASVLLQSARRVESDETRSHLYDAHQRVMSVAAVQKQLAATTLGNVGLRTYFTELCQSIGASMIRDHRQISLEVNSDDAFASAGVSVSLGLVVTELVINALKHAFPGKRRGRISLDYRAGGDGWTLSVSDDGVGMPTDPSSAKAGLGTSIVQALAQQLNAHVVMTPVRPGHRVSIVHPAGASLVA